MGVHQREATMRGLELIARGMPLRHAAKQVRVAVSTLVRARQRAGLPPLKRKRPRRWLEVPCSWNRKVPLY